MLRVAVTLDGDGALRRMRFEGHAGTVPRGRNGPRKGFRIFRDRRGTEAAGWDPACAAASLLARTVARVVASRADWIVDGSAAEPGNLFLDVVRRPEDTTEWLLGVTDTLMGALADIAEEFPGTLSVNVEEA